MSIPALKFPQGGECRSRATKTRSSKTHYETLAAFRYTLRQFLHFSEQAALAAGITAQQHQALLAIKGFGKHDRATVGELAERLQLRHHSTVGLVNRLMSEKLVVRIHSSQDRRRVFVHLTDHGERILGRLSTAHCRQLKRLAPELMRLLQRFC